MANLTKWLFCFLVSTAVIVAAVGREISDGEEARREADRVTNLPGQPQVRFQHYAGYVKLGPQNQRALFYWFFEAKEDASQKPLVLWLNGGPGCSSVAYGAAQELGPFLVRGNGTQLILNKYSWNKGHYVPQLAELIYERNKGATKSSYINLKGFMIGNAVINDETDSAGIVDYAWSHAIISDQLYHNIKQCDHQESVTNECVVHYRGFAEAYSDIDIYSIYTPVCLSDYSTRSSSRLVVAPRLLSKLHDLVHNLPSGYDPCTEGYAEKFFNREDVQKALHANVTKLSYPYTTCSNAIRKWNDSAETILPIIQKLLNAGLRIWIYSGDTDGRVPVTSTRYSINKMELKVNEEWRAWFHKSQVAGWVETYERGLVLATVRGAGHQVPVFAPQQSLSLFSHFLSAKTLPASSRF
ncbi:serine carboxypeptidase-like 35 isoform X1 [Populus alba x Populus x berolinensis]|nr:serine carboxypeptidase-like 35 isoform X1 [Populus alba x Populus x berolinensis]